MSKSTFIQFGLIAFLLLGAFNSNAQANLRKKIKIENVTIIHFNSTPPPSQMAVPTSEVAITAVTGVLLSNDLVRLRINWQAVENVASYQVIVKVAGQVASTNQVQGTEFFSTLPIANATNDVPIRIEVRSICSDCEETYSAPTALDVVYRKYLYNYASTIAAQRFGVPGAPTMPISDIEDIYPGSAFDCSTSAYARYSMNNPVYVYQKSDIAACVLLQEAAMLNCMANATKYISLNIENQNCGGSNTQFARNTQDKQDTKNTSDTQFFPNPATNVAYLTLELTQPTTSTLFIFDANGRVVATQKVNLLNLKNVLSIPIETLPTGLYSYYLSTPEKTITGKFMKTL